MECSLRKIYDYSCYNQLFEANIFHQIDVLSTNDRCNALKSAKCAQNISDNDYGTYDVQCQKRDKYNKAALAGNQILDNIECFINENDCVIESRLCS